jgi:hypothetical protein
MGIGVAKELFTSRKRFKGVWSALVRFEEGGRGYLVSLWDVVVEGGHKLINTDVVSLCLEEKL